MYSAVKPTSGRSKKVKALTSSMCLVPGAGIAGDHELGVVAVDRLRHLAVEIGEALRIGRARPVLPLRGEAEHHGLAARRPRAP